MRPPGKRARLAQSSDAARMPTTPTYFQPTLCKQTAQEMSHTTCRPVVISRSSSGPHTTFRTRLKRYALPFLLWKCCGGGGGASKGTRTLGCHACMDSAVRQGSWRRRGIAARTAMLRPWKLARPAADRGAPRSNGGGDARDGRAEPTLLTSSSCLARGAVHIRQLYFLAPSMYSTNSFPIAHMSFRGARLGGNVRVAGGGRDRRHRSGCGGAHNRTQGRNGSSCSKSARSGAACVPALSPASLVQCRTDPLEPPTSPQTSLLLPPPHAVMPATGGAVVGLSGEGKHHSGDQAADQAMRAHHHLLLLQGAAGKSFRQPSWVSSAMEPKRAGRSWTA